jgi:predicted PurR-regulated permease PerM|tara:strand:- start:857 stop:1294 length:438 start_codon:yes stop_codon:yes gene_type:complete
MEAGDLAAVLVAVVCLAAIVVLVVSVSSLVRTLRTLRETVDLLREEAVPMVADLRRAVDHATVGLERVDDLLDAAEDISTTVDAASRLTYRALSPPLIGAASIAAGLGRFVRRLRGATPGRGVDGPVVEAAAIQIRPENRRDGVA